MKKLSHFIPHLILVVLLVNRKVVEKRRLEDRLDLRDTASFSKKVGLSEKNGFRNVQSVKNPSDVQNPLDMDKRILSVLRVPENLKQKLMGFLLLTQRGIYSPGELDSIVEELNPHARYLVEKLTSNMGVLMNSGRHDWIVGPLIGLVDRLKVPILIKNDFYSKVVEFSRPEHFDSSRSLKAYGLQAIRQIARSNDFETIKTVFNSTVQKHGYNPRIFNELRDIDKEYNLMVKLKFGF